MILTKTLINTTVLKAFCALGTKTIKYYTGLAMGKNNTCLFKEMTLLRAYIGILKNFEIIGTIPTCCCSIEGSYLFNETGSPSSFPIQFLCDNIANNGEASFLYDYDISNKTLTWYQESSTPIFTDITFLDNCNFTAIYASTLYEFIRMDPCPSTLVEQTCLSNDDIKKVINKVNKIIK